MTFAAWCFAFLNATPAWRKDDDAEGALRRHVCDGLGVGLALGKILSDFAFASSLERE